MHGCIMGSCDNTTARCSTQRSSLLPGTVAKVSLMVLRCNCKSIPQSLEKFHSSTAFTFYTARDLQYFDAVLSSKHMTRHSLSDSNSIWIV